MLCHFTLMGGQLSSLAWDLFISLFSTFLMLWPYNTVLYLIVATIYKIILLLLRYCYESQWNYLIWRIADVTPQWSHNPQVENYFNYHCLYILLPTSPKEICQGLCLSKGIALFGSSNAEKKNQKKKLL